MLISHRHTAYMDNEEMERAAGLCEISAKTTTDSQTRDYYYGAARALRYITQRDLSDANALHLLLIKALEQYKHPFEQE